MAILQNETIDYSYLTDLVGHLSGLAHLRATQLCTVELSEIGLTPKQFVALEFIANNPSIMQKEIAEHIGTTPTVMVNVLDVLAKRGLIERVRSTVDRRRHSVKLTELGQEILPRVRESADNVEHALFTESNMSEAEWQQLIHLMQKLTQRAKS